ncbi:MAG: hypothetical protein IT364_27825 [Candidatus Hydrogenedentes bacterium]|nr:hypothetical protein [Candidatus Hydrogenedentota bacterium]
MRLSKDWLKRAVAVILAVYPLFAMSVFFSLVLRVRVSLGDWPQYIRPDPGSLHWDGHVTSVASAAWLVPLAVVVSVVLAAWPLFRSPWSAQRRSVLWFFIVLFLNLVSTLVLAAYVRYDPGGFVTWFLD